MSHGVVPIAIMLVCMAVGLNAGVALFGYLGGIFGLFAGFGASIPISQRFQPPL